MNAIVDRAIILRTWEYSETSQTVSLFTLGHGALRGLAKGARRERSTFGGGFEALTVGDVVFRLRATSELALLTEWNVSEIFWGPRSDLRAHRAALYASELIGAFITDRDAHPGLFHEAIRFLSALESPAAIAPALVRLQWAVLDETGHRPRIDSDAADATIPAVIGFDPEAGALVPDPGVPSTAIWRLRRETVEILRSITAGEPIDDRRPPALDRASRFLASCCRYQLGWEPQTAAMVFGNRLDRSGIRRGRGTGD